MTAIVLPNRTWAPTKLCDVCREVTVGHVGPMVNEYTVTGIPFLRSQNVLPFRLDLSSLKYIGLDFHRRLAKSSLHPGDVVVVRTGYPGTACVIPEQLPIANCADLVIIRPSAQVDPYYLAAIFNSAWGRGQVAGNLVGVAQQHFNIGAAKEMVIDLPPLPTQRKIAAILSAYDDLIENNTRRIAILEEMAQALYTEWFVRFRFPGHEACRLVDSPLGPVPEGWRAVKLSEMAHLSRTGISPSRYPDKLFAHHSMPAFDAGQMPSAEPGVSIKSSKFLVPDQAVLVAKMNPRIPRVWLPQPTGSCRAIASTEFLVLKPVPPTTREYLFSLSAAPEFLGELAKRAGGTSTSHQRVKPDDFMNLPVSMPTAAVMAAFSDRVAPTYASIHCLRSRNANLGRTRDLLLPKLIAGEADVEGLNIEMEGEPA